MQKTFSVTPSIAKLAVGSKELSDPGRQKTAGRPSLNRIRISARLAMIISIWAFSDGLSIWTLQKAVHVKRWKFVLFKCEIALNKGKWSWGQTSWEQNLTFSWGRNYNHEVEIVLVHEIKTYNNIFTILIMRSKFANNGF